MTTKEKMKNGEVTSEEILDKRIDSKAKLYVVFWERFNYGGMRAIKQKVVKMVNERLFRKGQLMRDIVELQIAFKGNFAFQLLEKLHKIGIMTRKHKRLCECLCNDAGFKPELIEQQESKINHALSEVNNFIHDQTKRIRAEYQHDPRGNTAKIVIKTGCFDHQLWEILQ